MRKRSVKYTSSFFGGRHPFQLFLLVLSFITGLPLVASLGGSQSDIGVSPVILLVWGIMLTGGSLTALMGTYWPADVITRLTIERIGLAAVGYGALMYGLVTVVETFTVSVALEVAVLVGLAITCLWRAGDIAREIRQWTPSKGGE